MKFAHAALTAASSRTLQPSFIVRATPQKRQNNSPQGSKTRSTAVLRRAKATALRGKETVAPKNWRGCFLCQKRTSKKYTYFDIETLEKSPLKSGVFGDFLPYNPPEKVWQYNFMPKTFQAPYRAFLNKKHF